MLPTNEKAGLVLNPSTNKIQHIDFERSSKYYTDASFICNHLYILSDDEIKEGDWCIESGFNRIFQIEKESLTKDYIKNCKKIIATTDTSLCTQVFRKDGTPTSNYSFVLPQPSQSFIEKYVAEYNKGNMITDVLVEYEAIGNWRHAAFVHTQDIPKVSKNNTITIKKMKDSWTREEVLKLTKTTALVAFVHPEVFAEGVIFDDNKFNKWIEENL